MREVWEVASEASANDECLPHLAGQHSTATAPVSGTVLSSGIRDLSLRGAQEARSKFRSATRPRLQSLVWRTLVVHRGFAVCITPAEQQARSGTVAPSRSTADWSSTGGMDATSAKQVATGPYWLAMSQSCKSRTKHQHGRALRHYVSQ